MTTPRPPHDAAVRAEALDVRRSFLVQAPAGSGKTELLTDRILALLPSVDDPEEIVAITFTKKAAAEMHARVLEKLRDPQRFSPMTQQLVAEVMQHGERRGWRLLDEPQRLRIQTIDSLAGRIAQQLPYLARLGGGFATTDEAQALYQEAARLLLADLEKPCPHQQALIRLLDHLDNDLPIAENLLVDMLGRRDQWLYLLPRERTDWNALRERLEASLRKVIDEEFQYCIRHLPDPVVAVMQPIACFMAEQLDQEGRSHLYQPVVELDAGPCPRDLDQLFAWQALASMLLTAGGEWRKTFNKTNGLPADLHEAKIHKASLLALLEDYREHESARHALTRLLELPQPAYSDSQWAVLQALFSVLKVAAAYLWLTFQKRGTVDFTEVSARALEALGEEDAPSDVLLALDYRLRHLLVDEFQDTSLTQIRLLTRLTAGWEEGDGRTLFLVGDPMQSIYRFRKAEVSLFLEAKQQGIGSVRLTPLTLSDNFRSQAQVVEWVNEVFESVLPQEDDVLAGAIRYTQAIAYNPADEGPAVQMHAFWPQSPFEQSLIDAVRQGLALAPDSTVAILGRTRKHLEAAMHTLREAAIPFRAVDLQPLSEQPWIQDLLQLTRALVHPADRLAWSSVLRAPWCGLTLPDFDRLCGDDHRSTLLDLFRQRIDALSEDGQRRARRVWRVMEAFFGARERQPITVAVEAAWQMLGGPQTLPHEAARVDCEAFFDWLEKQTWPLDLDSLEDRLRRLFATPDPKPEAARVVVMTMHKSKGLQFDTVILPSLEGRSSKDSLRLLLTEEAGHSLLFAPVRRRDGSDDDRLYKWLANKEAARARHESGRLLYVAATRAKRRLHLFASLLPEDGGRVKPPPGGSLLSVLWPVLYEQFQPPGLPPDEVKGEIATPPQPLQRLPEESLPDVAIVDSTLPGDMNVPFQPPSVPAAIGTVVHAWLEQIGRHGIEAWLKRDLTSLRPLIHQQLRAEGVPHEAIDSAVQRTQLALARTLSDPTGRWLLSAQHEAAASEWDWLAHDDEGRVGHHIIDRSFVDGDGQRWIIDFKTSAPEDGWSLDTFIRREVELYRPQLERYARLFGNEPVRLGLYFALLPKFVEVTPINLSSNDYANH